MKLRDLLDILDEHELTLDMEVRLADWNENYRSPLSDFKVEVKTKLYNEDTYYHDDVEPYLLLG